MIKIGDLAKICNVTTQTLRYYDAEGILKPDITDSSSGYRFYSVDAVEKYKKILFYKELGFSLEEIKKIQTATNEELQEILEKKKVTLSESIDKVRGQIKTIEGICEESQKRPLLSEMLILPFENDEVVVGKWWFCGRLIDENDLSSFVNTEKIVADKELIFMPGGAFAWKYFWTKGTLYRISPKYTFAIPNSYKAYEKNGVRYMVIQYMTDECIDSGEDAILLLYRQIDNIAYTEHQIRPHIDKTDMPFVDDEAVHGSWRAFDYVHKISDFDPLKRNRDDEHIYMVDIIFLPRGICTRTISSLSGNTTYMLRYTKGFVLNDKEMTAEEYLIKTVNDKDYLFVQHKSGDYFYGGLTPHWYVFVRKDN